jgi:hypothetical protein
MEMDATALKLEVAALCLEVQASRVKEEAAMVARQGDRQVGIQGDHREAMMVCLVGAQGWTHTQRHKGGNCCHQ